MSFRTTPLFNGDMFDTALRVAMSSNPTRVAGAAHQKASPKWQQMLNLGWQGVLIAEADGGVGASLADMAMIVEAASRHAQEMPLTNRCAVAPVLLTAARSHASVAALLEQLAVGEASACAVLDGSAQTPGAVNGVVLGSDGVLMGMLRGADLSELASHVVFPARMSTDATPVLLLLPYDMVAARARHYEGTDARQCTDITLDGLVVGDSHLVLRGDAVTQALATAQRIGAVLGCVQAVGAVASMIELSIEYLNTRVQFGVQLSSFQALRHRTVEMYVAYENTSGLVRRLVQQAEVGVVGYSREIALAKMYAVQVSRQAAESAIQLHGGMGMSLEMLVARLAMHAMAGSLSYGSRTECLDWLTNQSLAEATRA